MKTFIKVSEIWIPDPDHTHLVLKDGIYGTCKEFKAFSQEKKFAYGKGLPGNVWATGHPVVLTHLDDSYFERTEEAHNAGLTCAIGIPVYVGEFIMAVVVFLCGDDEEHAGAIEYWANDYPDRSNELGVVDGYYGTLEYFEFVSRKTKIMKGFGLPGLIWEKEMPVLMNDLGESASFIRGRDAKNAGITTGIGIPVLLQQECIDIMVFLSAKSTPIARRLQIWLPDENHEKLYCDASYGTELDELIGTFEERTFSRSQELLGKVWLSGVPDIGEITLGDMPENAVKSGILAIPVVNKGVLSAVVTFLF